MRKNEAQLSVFEVLGCTKLWGWHLTAVTYKVSSVFYSLTERVARQAGIEWAKEHNIEVVE